MRRGALKVEATIPTVTASGSEGEGGNEGEGGSEGESGSEIEGGEGGSETEDGEEGIEGEGSRASGEGENSDGSAKSKEPKTAPEAARAFCEQPRDAILAATKVEIPFNRKGGHVTWHVLPEGKEITKDVRPAPDRTIPNIDVTRPLDELYFEHGFGDDLDGAGARMTEMLHRYSETARSRKVFFTDDDIKTGILMLLAAAGETASGVEGLFSKEKVGRREPTNFGRYMEKEKYKLFMKGLPALWMHKDNWGKAMSGANLTWKFFQPVMDVFNKIRLQTSEGEAWAIWEACLDESMSGWRPKTSKLGGMPNLTHEPRKPVPLGTMFKNIACLMSGHIVFNEPQEGKEGMAHKKYRGEKSSLPSGKPIGATTASPLRLCAGMKRGGWVAADAWFGSVMTAVELFNRLGVFCTMVVKGATHLFPKAQLECLLRTRYSVPVAHGEEPRHKAGSHVVMTCKIAGVQLYAVAYAWSRSSIALFVSTCGVTTPAASMYTVRYDNGDGDVVSKEYPRPQLVSDYYEAATVIDDDNKLRQASLGLEKRWPTQNCWRRLVVTLIGMSAVCLNRLMQKACPDVYFDRPINEFVDRMCGALDVSTRIVKARKGHKRDSGAWSPPPSASPRKLDKYRASEPKSASQSDRQRGHNKKQRQANCWECRRWKTKYRQTTFTCPDCLVPICSNHKHPRAQRKTDNQNRPAISCLEQHRLDTDPEIKCDPARKGQRRTFPAGCKVAP